MMMIIRETKVKRMMILVSMKKKEITKGRKKKLIQVKKMKNKN